MDDTKRELDLLWNQGVGPIREDIKEVKADVKSLDTKIDTKIEGLSKGISDSRRWIIGLLLSLVPAYIGIVIEVFKK
jgi:hypothetical protein